MRPGGQSAALPLGSSSRRRHCTEQNDTGSMINKKQYQHNSIVTVEETVTHQIRAIDNELPVTRQSRSFGESLQLPIRQEMEINVDIDKSKTFPSSHFQPPSPMYNSSFCNSSSFPTFCLKTCSRCSDQPHALFSARSPPSDAPPAGDFSAQRHRHRSRGAGRAARRDGVLLWERYTITIPAPSSLRSHLVSFRPLLRADA